MKINMIKMAGGILQPASDMDADRLTRFKTGEQYEIEVRLSRNPDFHRKVFQFFQYCFEFWRCDREFVDEAGQFDLFRKNLTVLAGHYREYYKIDGSIRIEAESLSYGSMDQERFERVYQSLIQAAISNLFKGEDSQTVYNRLAGFF